MPRHLGGSLQRLTAIAGRIVPIPLRSGNRGFTLVELLLAFFIFGIVAATVFGSYRSVFSGAQAVLDTVTDDEMGLSCIHRMTLDLGALQVSLPPFFRAGGFGDDPDPHRFAGRKEWIGGQEFATLRFASLSHVPMGPGPPEAVAEIRYFVEDSGTGGYILKRSDRPYPFFEDAFPENAPVLCDRVRSLAMTFFDQEGTPFETWDSDSVDSGRATPAAVHIRLEVGDSKGSRAFETRLSFPVIREKQNR